MHEGKGWHEAATEVSTHEGVRKIAKRHHDVAVKKEAGEANNTPMEKKPAHEEQAQEFDWTKIYNYPNLKHVYLGQHGVFERLEGKDKERFIKDLSEDVKEHGSWEKSEDNAREFFKTKGAYYDEKGNWLVESSKTEQPIFLARTTPADLKHKEGNKYYSASAEKHYYRIDERWYIDKPKKMDDSDIDYLYNREIKSSDLEGELHYYKIIYNSAGFGKGLGSIYQARSPKEALEIHDKAHVSGYPISIKHMTDEEYNLSSIKTNINIEKHMIQKAKENLIQAKKEKNKAWIANSEHDIKTRQEYIDNFEKEKEILLAKREPPLISDPKRKSYDPKFEESEAERMKEEARREPEGDYADYYDTGKLTKYDVDDFRYSPSPEGMLSPEEEDFNDLFAEAVFTGAINTEPGYNKLTNPEQIKWRWQSAFYKDPEKTIKQLEDLIKGDK